MQAPGGIALRQMLGAGRLLDEKMNAGARDERNRLAFARLMLLYNNNSPPRSPASRVPPFLFSCVLSGIAPQPVLPFAVVGRSLGLRGEGVMKRRDLLQGGAAALMLSPALAAAQGLPVLQGCSVQQQGGLLRLRLELLGAQVAYRSFRLADPERLVIDLFGVSSQAPRIDPIPAGAAVTRIRSAAHLDGLRVVFDLQRPCSVNLRWQDSALVLELAPLRRRGAGRERCCCNASDSRSPRPRPRPRPSRAAPLALAALCGRHRRRPWR